MKFKIVKDDCPEYLLECRCKMKFWISPFTEENLNYNGRWLYPVCPKCGEYDLEKLGFKLE